MMISFASSSLWEVFLCIFLSISNYSRATISSPSILTFASTSFSSIFSSNFYFIFGFFYSNVMKRDSLTSSSESSFELAYDELIFFEIKLFFLKLPFLKFDFIFQPLLSLCKLSSSLIFSLCEKICCEIPYTSIIEIFKW